MDWFPCDGNEGWYPCETGRRPYLLWVWQLVCPVYRLSQDNNPVRESTRNVMSAVVTVIHTV
jgi:hypothetical protein